MARNNVNFTPVYSASTIISYIRMPKEPEVLAFATRFEPFKTYLEAIQDADREQAQNAAREQIPNESMMDESFDLCPARIMDTVSNAFLDGPAPFEYGNRQQGKKARLPVINGSTGYNFVKPYGVQHYKDETDFWISSKVDGLDKEKQTIVRIRTGETKLTEYERFVEKIQITSQMKANNCLKCLIYESDQENDFPQIYEFDEKQFNEIISKLRYLTKQMRSITQEELNQMVKKYPQRFNLSLNN